MEVCSASWECRARVPGFHRGAKESLRGGETKVKVQSGLAAEETDVPHCRRAQRGEKMLSSEDLKTGLALLTLCRARQARNGPLCTKHFFMRFLRMCHLLREFLMWAGPSRIREITLIEIGR